MAISASWNDERKQEATRAVLLLWTWPTGGRFRCRWTWFLCFCGPAEGRTTCSAAAWAGWSAGWRARWGSCVRWRSPPTAWPSRPEPTAARPRGPPHDARAGRSCCPGPQLWPEETEDADKSAAVPVQDRQWHSTLPWMVSEFSPMKLQCFCTIHRELTWNIVNMPLSCPWICLFLSWPCRPSWKTPGCRRCRPTRSRPPQSSNVWADPDHRGALWCHKAWAVPSRRGQSPPRPRTRPPGSRRTQNLKQWPNHGMLARRKDPHPLRYLRTDYVISVQKLLEDRRFSNCRLTTNHNFTTFPHFGPEINTNSWCL